MTGIPSSRGSHKGDIMSPETRSRVMSRIKGKNTGPERQLAEYLSGHGFSWESHVRSLPGTPDFVFQEAKVAVFVDGDFWHGWRFPQWKHKLSPSWQEKIGKNRTRDKRNHRKLRRIGWKVIRIWEHQLNRDPEACVRRISEAFKGAATKSLQSTSTNCGSTI
jgi:DNA mismatch endonuclease, patch repair protein